MSTEYIAIGTRVATRYAEEIAVARDEHTASLIAVALNFLCRDAAEAIDQVNAILAAGRGA